MEFDDLILRHKGKRICVMGGAPSLASDIDGLDADIWISANDHGALLREVDYIVAMDVKHQRKHKEMMPYLKSLSDAPVIGPQREKDIQLPFWPGSPKKTLSGLVGAWLAYVMGARVVILAGMDAYSGKASSMEYAKQTANEVKCPVRIFGGPLAKYWPIYDPAEKFGRYKESGDIRGLLGIDEMIEVIAKKPTSIRGESVKKGDKVRGMRHEFKTLLKHGMVAEL
jgi:protein-tyrosine-phosphatase